MDLISIWSDLESPQIGEHLNYYFLGLGYQPFALKVEISTFDIQ